MSSRAAHWLGMEDGATIVCETGPDSGVSTPLGDGPVVVGRSPLADLIVNDPSIELHHLVVEALPNGHIRVTQLSGRAATRVGGHPVTAGSVVVPSGAVVSVGASRLRLGPARDPSEVEPVPAPSAEPRRVGVWWRRGRGHAHTEAFDGIDPLTGEVEHGGDMASATRTVAEVVLAATTLDQRIDDDGTMFRVHLGVVDTGSDEAGGIVTDLEPGSILHLLGPGAAGVARSIVVQLAAQVPSDRMKLVVVGATGWLPDGVQLPHLGCADGAEHVIVMAAGVGMATLEPTALRTRLGVGPAAAIVVLDDRSVGPDLALPGGRLCLGALGRGRWSPGVDVLGARPIHAAGVEPATVVRFASRWGAPLAVQDRTSVGDALAPTIERLALGDAVSTIDVVRTWQASRRPAVWLGRERHVHRWVHLTGGSVVVIGDDAATRRATLDTYAAALVLEHDPARLDLVLGPGQAGPSGVHGTGVVLPTGRLVHELARPRPRSDRSTVVVTDDELGPDPLDLLAAARRADLHAVLGLRPDHPWCRPLLDEPSTTVVVTGVASAATARSLVGDSRACRLGPGQVLVRSPDEPTLRVLRVPVLTTDALRSIETTVAHAAALVGAAVRSCGPCPDDDSRWAPPSSDPSNEPMIVGVSSSGCSPS